MSQISRTKSIPATPRRGNGEASPGKRIRGGYAKKADADAVIRLAQDHLSRLDRSELDPVVGLRVMVAVRHAIGVDPRDVRTGPARRRELVRQLASGIQEIPRTIPEADLECFFNDCRVLQFDPLAHVGLLADVMADLSDIFRALIEPWDHDIIRRFGIVAGPNGYPVLPPTIRTGELLGHLRDELDYLVIRSQVYTLLDLDGDPYDVVGPTSHADGTVDGKILRAFAGITAAAHHKSRELLLPPAERKLGTRFGPEWPWPTRLPGFRNGKINIAEYLAAEKFGLAADSEADLVELQQPSRPPNYPALPPARERRGR